MASVNKVILVGNLGADPEKRYLGSGQPVCNLRMATSDRWTDKQGNKQERTEWHRVVVYGPQAENCEKYLAKGRQVYVEGSIRTRQWEDQEGKTRYTTEVIAQRVQFLGGAPANRQTTTEGESFPEPQAEPAPETPSDQTTEEDVPF